jgi:hypothetical protein
VLIQSPSACLPACQHRDYSFPLGAGAGHVSDGEKPGGWSESKISLHRSFCGGKPGARSSLILCALAQTSRNVREADVGRDAREVCRGRARPRWGKRGRQRTDPPEALNASNRGGRGLWVLASRCRVPMARAKCTLASTASPLPSRGSSEGASRRASRRAWCMAAWQGLARGTLGLFLEEAAAHTLAAPAPAPAHAGSGWSHSGPEVQGPSTAPAGRAEVTTGRAENPLRCNSLKIVTAPLVRARAASRCPAFALVRPLPSCCSTSTSPRPFGPDTRSSLAPLSLSFLSRSTCHSPSHSLCPPDPSIRRSLPSSLDPRTTPRSTSGSSRSAPSPY